MVIQIRGSGEESHLQLHRAGRIIASDMKCKDAGGILSQVCNCEKEGNG